MKKELKKRKDEPLHEWLDRIAEYWNFGTELREVLAEVSKESYIKGSNDTVEKFKPKGE